MFIGTEFCYIHKCMHTYIRAESYSEEDNGSWSYGRIFAVYINACIHTYVPSLVARKIMDYVHRDGVLL
jgi:hypothetical protein